MNMSRIESERPFMSSRVLALVAVVLALAVVPAYAADVVTVGTVNTSSTTVDVPVYIRDASGTPLGMDKDPSSRIQSFSIKVTYAPASAVSSVTFSRSGITASLNPTSEFTPKTTGTASLLSTFQQSTNPIPFNLNASSPGDKVAHLVFTLAASATPGTNITLTLDPSLTQLTDEGGTAATKETQANGHLNLVDGAIHVQEAPLTLSINPATRTINVGSSTTLTVLAGSPVSSSTTISLSSSSSAATVPASVIIAAGQQQANFNVNGVSEGDATITASASGASATARVSVRIATNCAVPAAPQISGPSTAHTNVPFTISWPAVADATDYVLEDANNSAFTGATSTTTTTTSAVFTRGAGTYFFRVRARNRSTGCDIDSLRSATLTVVVTDTPVAAMRIVPVVGTTRGNAGSFFKTSVQLYNPTSATISGRIIYHPQGASGASTDPALAYAIAAGKSVAYDDLLPAMAIDSGVGSADIIADIVGNASSAIPVASFRIYNDGGAAGTTGLVEEPMRAEEALGVGDTGVLLAPASVQKFRLNVGIRTLDEGADVTITVRDADGATVASTTRTYDPQYFLQTGSSQFLDGYALKGGETISVAITRGRAILYGAITDNITNDPSQQFARKAN